MEFFYMKQKTKKVTKQKTEDRQNLQKDAAMQKRIQSTGDNLSRTWKYIR